MRVTDAKGAKGYIAYVINDLPPSGQWFKPWSGNAAVTDSFATTTTFTMPSANVTESALYYPPAPIPQPVATHPRLWLTPADLPKYQAWATASNPGYQQGLRPLLNQAIADYNAQFFPNGQPASPYPDLGDTQGYQGLLTEHYALIFAFNSLIDPDPTARIQHAQRARNLIVPAAPVYPGYGYMGPVSEMACCGESCVSG